MQTFTVNVCGVDKGIAGINSYLSKELSSDGYALISLFIFLNILRFSTFFLAEMSRTGLAFSGGGIRSAAFCSGVLRRLLQRDVKVNYLSCVSGGGYTGTAYLDWKYRHENTDDPKWHQEFFDNMRSRVGYICNWQKPLTAVFESLLLVVLIILVAVVSPVIMWMSFACPLAYAIDYLVGNLLRSEGCAEIVARNQTKSTSDECAVKGDAYRRIILFASFLIIGVLSFMLQRIMTHCKMLFKFISISSTTILALLVFPWAIHDFLEGTPAWVQVLILFLAAIVWFSTPVLRQQSSLVMVLYAYAFVIHTRVYRHSLFGYEYSPYHFNVLVWVSGISLCFVPFIGSIQQRLMHVYNRYGCINYACRTL